MRFDLDLVAVTLVVVADCAQVINDCDPIHASAATFS